MSGLVRLFSTSATAFRIGYKLPSTPWKQYLKDNFLNVKLSRGEASIGEITQILSSQWKEAPLVRAQYEAEYEKKLEGFKNKDPEFAYVVKPLKPFAAFSAKNYKKISSELKTKNSLEIKSAIEQRWSELSDSEKEALESKYKKQIRKYKRETDENKVVRPLGAFFEFLKDYRKDNLDSDKPYKELVSEASVSWSVMSVSEKSPYVEQYQEALAKYKQEVEKNKVHRPLSVYAQFVKENYNTFKNQNPDLAPPELLKLIASEWQNSKY